MYMDENLTVLALVRIMEYHKLNLQYDLGASEANPDDLVYYNQTHFSFTLNV